MTSGERECYVKAEAALTAQGYMVINEHRQSRLPEYAKTFGCRCDAYAQRIKAQLFVQAEETFSWLLGKVIGF